MAGCDESTPAESNTADGWPVGSPIDAVLAYLAVSPQADDFSPLFERFLGWRPAGLANDRMAVLVLLDESMLSGLAGLALPVADAEAFRRSLEESHSVTFTEDDRFVLTLSPESELLTAVRLGRAAMSGGSFVQRMAAMSQSVSTTSTWDLSFRAGHALMVPSFEAEFVLRKLLEKLPLDVDANSPSHVVCLDVERFELAYFEQIQNSRRQLEALLSAEGAGGVAGLLGQMLSESGAASEQLPVDGPTILALLEMMALDSIGAYQFQLFDMALIDRFMSPDEFRADEAQPIRSLSRLRWKEPTALSELLATLRPSPEQRQGLIHGVLSADADLFAAALPEWLRPLVELVHGKGAAANDALTELTELLSPWGGQLVMGLGSVAVVTCQPGERFDSAGLFAWFRSLAAAVAGEDDPGDLDLPVSTFLVDDLLAISFGDDDPLMVDRALDEARAVRDSGAPEAGPSLRIVFVEARLSLSVSDELIEVELAYVPADEERR